MICGSFFGSQNLLLLPRIYPPFQQIYMCDPPRIYPSLPEYTPLFNKFICATLPESTPPSQNLPPFSTNLYVRPSQNLPLPPRIYPPPLQQMYMCNPLRIYPNLPEYTLLFNKFICATLPESTPPSQNLHPPCQSIYMCDPPKIYPSLPEYTPLFNNYNIMRPSHNLPRPHRDFTPGLIPCSFLNSPDWSK